MSADLFVNYNGQFYADKEYVISHKNRAFRYGDGLFETIRQINGNVLYFHDHYLRMMAGMKYLKMGFDTFGFSEQYLMKEILKTAEKNKALKSCIIRLEVFRNYGGKYTPEKNECSYLIEAEPLAESLYRLNDKGLKLGIFEDERKPLSQLSNFKTCNSLIYVLAGLFKVENGYGEVLLLNQNKTISEAVSSNVFIVKNGDYFTPPLQDGCVDGVLRKQILRHLKIDNKKVVECSLTEEHLLTADEVFLTNAAIGIHWVGAYKHKRYFNNHSRKLVDQLNKIL